MELFHHELVVSKIVIAVFVPFGRGKPVHKNRPNHGFAFNVDCDIVYRFDTGETLTCHSGELIYLPKGSNYTVSFQEEYKGKHQGVYAINFFIADDQGPYPPKLVKVKGKEDMLSAFTKSVNAWTRKTVGFYEQGFIDLYKIIKILKKEFLHYSATHQTLEIIQPALKYIEENYTQEKISTVLLAELCQISEPYLRKLFHSTFSVSPIIYIRNLRIKYAKELLRAKEYSITDAAMMSGFNDVAYFSREFKKATGISPKEYVALSE